VSPAQAEKEKIKKEKAKDFNAAAAKVSKDKTRALLVWFAWVLLMSQAKSC